ncbi:MAG: signal peptidase I [Marmoricola sp.]
MRRLAVAAVLCVVALRVFVIEPVLVPSASMAPTLRPGDHVLSTTLDIGGDASMRGALVTFRRPASGVLTLKRIAGVGGDLIEIRDGVLYVNGRRHVEPYVDARTVDSVYFGPVRVPHGTVFVLGDNRADSEDSRTFGPVPTVDLVGRVLVRVWPLGDAGLIR